MSYRRTPFAPMEWYHLYSRGIDGRKIFSSEDDFRRFQVLLYLCNSTEPVNLELLKQIPYNDLYKISRPKTIISIGSYCLMSNHPHIVVQANEEGGVVTFMRKLGTAYTMYFNKKNDRIGNLMVKPFRSKHIDDDDYLRRVVQYVHLNPAEIFESGWKQGKVDNIDLLVKQLLTYDFSSLPEYMVDIKDWRPEGNILDQGAYNLLRAELPQLKEILLEAADYYREIEKSFEAKIKGPKIKGVTF